MFCRPATHDAINTLRNKLLRRLIARAYQTVPYYRRLMDRDGLKPADFNTVADLPKFPISSKEDFLSCPRTERIATDLDAKRLIVRDTSGSSGMPFEIRRTWIEQVVHNAIWQRGYRDFGLRPSDKLTSVMLQHPRDPRDHQWLRRVLGTIGINRRYTVGCFDHPREIIDSLLRIQPNAIIGYSGVLAQVAQTMSQSGQHSINPRFVAPGGEVLTPTMRREIGEAFGSPVYETYGSHELGLIAWECPTTGLLHTCDDSVIVEVLKNGRPSLPGERGEVVATSLHAFAMPFIRYRIGDIVTQGESSCSCGEPFSTIRDVQGRMIDYFPLPDGRLIHPYQLSVSLKNLAPWIRKYQLVQERKDRFTYHVVPLARPSKTSLGQLADYAAKILGPDIEFRINVVAELQPEASGKFRPSRSLVRSNYEGIDWDNIEHMQTSNEVRVGQD